MHDKSFLHVGAAAAMAGGAIGLVGNLLHPRLEGDDVDDVQAIADSSLWVVDHAALLVAALLVTVGTVAVAGSLDDGTRPSARLGVLAAYVGGAVAVANLGMETLTAKEVAVRYADAGPDAEGALFAALAMRDLEAALFASWLIVLLGVAPLAVGLAMRNPTPYPSWLAWLGIAAGLVNIGIGFATLGGVGGNVLRIVLMLAALAGTVWLILSGWRLWGLTSDGRRPSPQVS